MAIAGSSVQAQNLVPNGDFETYNSCPTGFSSIYPWPNFSYVQGWARPTEATPDYFNSCNASEFGVPANVFGYQQAHSGTGYAGFYAYTGDTDGREYLSAKLTRPMKKDSVYCVSFYLNLASLPPSSFSVFDLVAVSEVGVHFSNTLTVSTSATSLTLPYHVVSDTAVHMTDTNRWYEVRGAYQAKGGEEWITIGTFGEQRPKFNYVRGPNAGNVPLCYFYIDDVTVQTSASPVKETITAVRICDSSDVDTILRSSRTSGPYKWNTGETTQSLHVTRFGDYYCDSIENCTVYRERFQLNETPVSAPAVSDTMFCQNALAPQLNITDTGLLWYMQASGGAEMDKQPLINTSQKGTTTLYVARYQNGCLSKRAAVNIEIRPPLMQQPATHFLRCEGEPLEEITLGADAGPGVRYLWNSGDNRCCIHTSIFGVYVRSADNSCGAVQDSFFIDAHLCENCMFFPNIFSPNNDGRNDQFRPILRCPVKDFRLRVYNRWGQTVFYSEQPEASWDGTTDGRSAPEGVYMYFVSYRSFSEDGVLTAKGDVTLIR